MKRENIKKILIQSAFYVCPEDKNLIYINLNRATDALMEEYVLSNNNLYLLSGDELKKTEEKIIRKNNKK